MESMGKYFCSGTRWPEIGAGAGLRGVILGSPQPDTGAPCPDPTPVPAQSCAWTSPLHTSLQSFVVDSLCADSLPEVFPFQEPSGQLFTSKVGGFHPQIPGWFCPKIDSENLVDVPNRSASISPLTRFLGTLSKSFEGILSRNDGALT